MEFLVKRGRYGAISETYPTTMVCYFVKFISNTVILHEENIIDGQVLKACELSFITAYLSVMRSITNFYW